MYNTESFFDWKLSEPLVFGKVEVNLTKQLAQKQEISLNKRTKWHGDPENLKIDDLVLIADANNSRNCWPKEQVVAVYPGVIPE